MTDSASPASATARRRLWLGIGCGLGTSLIWGIQAVVSRQSVADGLSAADVTILRFVVASLLLLPLAWRRMRPFPVGKLGWRRALVLTALAGAPYALILVAGATFAPALHAAIIVPGLIPVMTIALAFLVLGERPSRWRLFGLALVLSGIAAFGWEGLAATGAQQGAWIGDLLFVANAALWSVFGLLARRWGTDATDVTIATCLLSLFILPILALTMPVRLGEAAWSAIALQAIYQGALVGVGALFLYTTSVQLLGAARTTFFLPLNPVVTALAAMVLLGEYPTVVEIAGMLLVIAGMSVALRAR